MEAFHERIFALVLTIKAETCSFTLQLTCIGLEQWFQCRSKRIHEALSGLSQRHERLTIIDIDLPVCALQQVDTACQQISSRLNLVLIV